MTLNSKHKWKKGDLGSTSMVCTQRAIPMDLDAINYRAGTQSKDDNFYVTMKLGLLERSY